MQKLVFGRDGVHIHMLHPLRTRTQRSCERTHLRLHTLPGAYSHPLCTRTPPAPPRVFTADKRKYAAGENAGETYAPICGIYTPDVYTPDGIYTLAETDERRRLCRWGDGGGGDDT